MTRFTPAILLILATACAAPAAIPTKALTATDEACEFPVEASQKGIESAVVTLQVKVDVTGAALDVVVLEDPGNGFGQAAARCAREQTYVTALDKHGTPIVATTPPFHMRFAR
jgi:periplasmic protein TonB